MYIDGISVEYENRIAVNTALVEAMTCLLNGRGLQVKNEKYKFLS